MPLVNTGCKLPTSNSPQLLLDGINATLTLHVHHVFCLIKNQRPTFCKKNTITALNVHQNSTTNGITRKL